MISAQVYFINDSLKWEPYEINIWSVTTVLDSYSSKREAPHFGHGKLTTHLKHLNLA